VGEERKTETDSINVIGADSICFVFSFLLFIGNQEKKETADKCSQE
jgi:hypothetical protein